MGQTAMLRTAVVVEPSARLRELVTVLLEETGYNVEESNSMNEALAVMQAKGMDVALLFIDLAGVEIESAARSVAQQWPWVRLIVPCSSSERGARLPPSAFLMQSPWNALDVLIQAERARQSALVH